MTVVSRREIGRARPYAAMVAFEFGRRLPLVSLLGRRRVQGFARPPASGMPDDGSVEVSLGYPYDPFGSARACSLEVDRFKYTLPTVGHRGQLGVSFPVHRMVFFDK